MNSTVKNALFVVAVIAGVKIVKAVLPGVSPQAASLVDKVL